MKKIFVVSGPSGVGKTSVVTELLKIRNNIAQVLSFTTREIRNNEFNGVHYNFISDSQFQDLYDKGDFIESVEVFGHRYGVSRTSVLELLNHKHALLVINWNGYLKLKEEFGDKVIGIFLMPPSFDILRTRIVRRCTDSAEEIERRLSKANEDMSHAELYDYVVVNDVIDDTVFEVAKIFDSVR